MSQQLINNRGCSKEIRKSYSHAEVKQPEEPVGQHQQVQAWSRIHESLTLYAQSQYLPQTIFSIFF